MNNIAIAFLMSLCALVMLGGCGIDNGQEQAVNDKPVIVLVAFGTSVPEAQKSFENIDNMVRKEFKGYDVRWAFTAQFIINKLKKNGQTTLFARKVPIKNLSEVYADLRKEGKTDVVIQSLHVVPGGEFTEMTKVDSSGLKVRVGQPLLSDDKAIADFAKVISKKLGGKDEVTILCGHGNDHHKEYNSEVVKLDKYVRANYKNVYVATVEGQPGTEKAFANVKKSGKKKVKFVPIMIVAGDHIMNDVMGDEDESWKKILGLPASSEGGMGMNDDVVGLYINHLRQAISN
ncbi:MAG: sirohydrochlorin cobaltochelatase [Planctomycetes bacterium]|nr:sirohydrochlorin cobaltochelatase [Planctomycetota bacterium]